MITFARDATRPAHRAAPSSAPEPPSPLPSGGSSDGSAPALQGSSIWWQSALFGAVFPIVGTLVEVGIQGTGLSLGSLLQAQASQPLLWIIDFAPLVLGVFGWWIGRTHDELDALRQEATATRVDAEIDRFLRLTPDPLAILSSDQRFVRVSPGFTRLLGYSAEHLLGTSILELIHSDDIGSPDARIRDRNALRDGAELRLQTQLGTWRTIRWSVVPVPEQDLVYVLGHDLTDELQTKAELVAARDAAEAAARAKSEFLANMSHELRTPMNGVIGMTDLALETELTEKQRLYLESIDESARALLETITDLLDFSQIETNKLALKRTSMTPARAIEQVIEDMKPAVHDKGLSLLYEDGPGLTWELLGDEERFCQVLRELMDNAIKFTERGEIAVKAECWYDEGGEALLEVSVRDTGIGLDPAEAARVFEAFSQADGSLTRQYGGTGLGLTIASQLVDMMGGRIDVQSALGAGSTFTVRLPMPMARVATKAPEPSEPRVRVPGPASRVLLVEDDRVNRVLTEAVLSRQGYEVTVAEDGAEAVAKFQAGDFDLVVMDIQIPVLDGLQATRKIRELEKDRVRRTPVLALTAHVAKGDRDACFQADMDDYIPKPVDPMQFEHVVKRHLDGPPPDFEWARATSLLGGEDALLERAADFVELGEGQLRAIMDALHRGDKIAVWQAARTIEAEASQLSLNRLRDVSHRVAVLIGRGRPRDAMELVDDLKQSLKDAISAVRTALGAVT